MPNTIRVMIEPGKKEKKVVAVAFDWPGWGRNGKTKKAAMATHDILCLGWKDRLPYSADLIMPDLVYSAA